MYTNKLLNLAIKYKVFTVATSGGRFTYVDDINTIRQILSKNKFITPAILKNVVAANMFLRINKIDSIYYYMFIHSTKGLNSDFNKYALNIDTKQTIMFAQKFSIAIYQNSATATKDIIFDFTITRFNWLVQK